MLVLLCCIACKYFFLLAASSLRWWFPLLYRSFSVWCSQMCLFCLWPLLLWLTFLRSLYQFPYPVGWCLCFPLIYWWFLHADLGSWSMWTWLLYQVTGRVLFLTSAGCYSVVNFWEQNFSLNYFPFSCQRWLCCSRVGFLLGFLFCSIDLLFLCTRPSLFWLPLYILRCGMVWFLQAYFCSSA